MLAIASTHVCIYRLHTSADTHFLKANFLFMLTLNRIFEWFALQQPSVGPCRAHGTGGSPQLNANIGSVAAANVAILILP